MLRAGIPNSSDPPRRVWCPLPALLVALHAPHGFFKVDLQQTAVLLGHCVPFSHSPVTGQLVGPAPPGMKHCPTHQSPWLWVYSNSFGAVGWEGHNPFCALGCPADTRSICGSRVKGTAETTRAEASVLWRWHRLKVLDPRFP